MEENFTYQDIFNAYRMLKSYFYYDTTNLFVRSKIAKFESKDIEEKFANKENFVSKFEALFGKVHSILNAENPIDVVKELLEEISYKVIPKEIKGAAESNSDKEANKEKDTPKSLGNFITNHQVDDKKVTLKDFNLLIDAPIELHIISVLWMKHVGVKLSSYVSDDNYANQLNYCVKNLVSEERKLKSGISVYKPYFIGYRKWRDKAISKAKAILDEGDDVAILSLDIKKYFYSVRLNMQELTDEYWQEDIYHAIDGKAKVLNELMQSIHEQYTEKVKGILPSDLQNGLEDKTLLPVGLISSGFIGNLYLRNFDIQVRKKVCPEYYGRYVDDMLFVFRNKTVETDSKKDPVKEFLDANFVNWKVLSESYSICNNKVGSDLPLGNASLCVNKDKIILEYFEAKGTHAGIDIFKRNIDAQRSEFRFLPEEERVNLEFDNEAYQLLVSGSNDKLRSIQDLRKDKAGATKFLAKKIKLSLLYNMNHTSANSKEVESTAKQILNYFNSETSISLCVLWEKIVTYFVLNHDYRSLQKFCSNVERTIQRIDLDPEFGLTSEHRKKVQNDLREYLLLALAQPLALNPNDEQVGKVWKKVNDASDKKFKDNLLKEKASFIRKANMFRHDLVLIDGLNLTEALFDFKVNLTQNDLKNVVFQEDEFVCYLSPRTVRFEYLNILRCYRHSSEISTELDKESDNISLREIEDKYWNLNHDWENIFPQNISDGIQKKLGDDNRMIHGNDEYIIIRDTVSLSTPCAPNKRVALANLKVNPSNFMNVVKYQRENLTYSRYELLCKIVNEACQEKSQILILPELSVPFDYLNVLVEQVKRFDMAVITGLEYHIKRKKEDEDRIYNCVATILPVQTEYGTTAVVHLREKNFYSPKEGLVLNGYHYSYNDARETGRYNLFHWRKNYFSVFNCFELADLKGRAKFLSQQDFVVAVEYNKDVNYYSNIVDSWARDIHAFIIQVNTSDYGDSKIVQPTSTTEKTIVQVKGGLNSVVLVSDLKVDELRDYQLKGYPVQTFDSNYKFTPPGYDYRNVLKRIKNEEFYEGDTQGTDKSDNDSNKEEDVKKK